MSHHHHNHDIDYKKNFTVTPKEGSTVEIAGELPFAALQEERRGALAKLGEQIKVDGFRPGHIPEKVIEGKVGEMAILNEMAERAIAHHYWHIIEVLDVKALGYPQISITKLAPDNPLGFTATVAVLQDIALPDYKQLAHVTNLAKESDEVTEADVEEQINDILRQKMAYDRLQSKAKAKAEESETKEEATTEEAPIETEEDLKKLPLPELNDELVATLGQPGQFKDVADFKAKIREHLEIDKKRAIAASHRVKLTDAVLAETKMELPQVLIDSEMQQMLAQMQDDLDKSNLKMDDYLQHIKKTKEDLKAEWAPAAEKRAKLHVLLREIALAEKIEPEAEAMNKEVEMILKQYKEVDERRVRLYVAEMMQNEAVMKLLEEA